MEQWKSIVTQLEETEAKTFLLHMILRLDMVKQTAYTSEELTNDLFEMADLLEKQHSNETEVVEHKHSHVHLVFGQAVFGSLHHSLNRKTNQRKHKILAFHDIFSVGPIANLASNTGLESRYNWLRTHCINEPFEAVDELNQSLAQFKHTLEELNQLPPTEPIFIWASENAHEQTGLRFASHFFKNRENPLYYVNPHQIEQQLSSDEDIIDESPYTGSIDFKKIKSLFTEVNESMVLTPKTKYELAMDWERLSHSNAFLRLWIHGHIADVPTSMFDHHLITFAKAYHFDHGLDEWIPITRLIGETLGVINQYTGDGFLAYRMKQLINAGVFEMEQTPKLPRFYRVRLLPKE